MELKTTNEIRAEEVAFPNDIKDGNNFVAQAIALEGEDADDLAPGC
ncbi:hypothetical protein ABID65_007551 [Bradyrhizobium sp. S3.9.2]